MLYSRSLYYSFSVFKFWFMNKGFRSFCFVVVFVEMCVCIFFTRFDYSYDISIYVYERSLEYCLDYYIDFLIFLLGLIEKIALLLNISTPEFISLIN